MARLRVEAGKSQGKVVDVERQAVIGRGETAQLQINDLKASREHCKVFEQAGAWTVADLNSRNGIKVNGVQTTRKALSHGDRIEIGETVLVFEVTGAAETGDSLPPAKSAAASPPAASSPAAKPAAPSRPAAPVRPAVAARGGLADKKAAAMAEARAAARKDPAAASAPAGATTKKAGTAAATGKGLEVSDRVLQFHKVDPRKATLMDVDLGQSAGGQKALIWAGCLAFLGGVIWLFGSVAGAW
jgi:hypothetical protein